MSGGGGESGVEMSVIACFTFALYADFFRPREDKSTSLEEAAPQQECEKRVMKLFRSLLNMYERLAGNQMSRTPRSHRVSRSLMKRSTSNLQHIPVALTHELPPRGVKLVPSRVGGSSHR